jgi:chitodextrinase
MLNVTTAADAQAPTVPGGLSTSAVTGTGLTLNWAASTDLPNPGALGVGGYYVYRGGVPVATITNGTAFTDSGLTASTHYSYQIAAFDRATPTANVSALSAPYTASTAGDTQPPTVPAGLTASNVSVAGVTLSWSASTDLPNPGGTGVGGYYVYRNGARVGTASSTSFSDGNLTASTTYSYQVAAFDKESTPNVSTLSAALPVTTLADTQPPTVPTGLTAANIGLSSATLSWNVSTDQPNPGATGVGGYIVYRGGINVGTTPSSSYTDNSLAPGSSYSYQVAAFDKATPTRNTSSLSAAYAVTTKSNMTVTPANAALTLSQTQQFTTNAAAGTTLNWYVDGIQGGSSALGTISSTGRYTPPATAGIHTVRAASSSNPNVSGTSAVAVTNLSGVTTYLDDLARTGQNLKEYALTPASVSSGSFGKLWSCALDGITYAQPLYMADLLINGATHNVLFVATMHDSVYAFDADSGSCQPLWKVSFINPSAGVTTSPSICNDTPTEYGITGTPVIDPASQSLYLVASTKESTGTVQRLHALNILTGADRTTASAIQAQIPGTGDNSTTVSFNAVVGNQRPGLVLTNGNVYIGWASHCDTGTAPWHGWLMSYNAGSLLQTGILNVTPNGNWGGIWMSGAAPAVDSTGNNIYLSTGNGAFDNISGALPALSPNNDFGESFLNVDPNTLQVQDFYTPSQYAAWAGADLDISSGAVMVLPDGMGPPGHANVLIGTDKQGHLWMIDRNNMSGYVPGLDNTVQHLSLPNASKFAIHSALGYWNQTLYISVGGGPLMAFQLANGLVPASGSTAIAASRSAQTYSFPNPTPSISATPNGNAIVWVLDNNANGTGSGGSSLGPAILRAYDATNLGNLLYSSSARTADTAGNASKFVVPVIANGHVYVVGHDALTVYGLAP